MTPRAQEDAAPAAADPVPAAGGSTGAAGSERIELSMPATPDLLALARMAASVAGSRLELDYEQIEDLRLAINELATLCTAGVRAGGRMLLAFSTDRGGLRIDCTVEPPPAAPAGETPDRGADGERVAGLLPEELAERILAALVDAHGLEEEDAGGARRGWLWKRRPSR